MKILVLHNTDWVAKRFKEVKDYFPFIDFTVRKKDLKPTYEEKTSIGWDLKPKTETRISDEYMLDLVKDYDGVVLIGDFRKMTIRGLHSFVNGKHLMQVDTTEKRGVRWNKTLTGWELRNTRSSNRFMDQMEYTTIHEIGHLIEKELGISNVSLQGLHLAVRLQRFHRWFADKIPQFKKKDVFSGLLPMVEGRAKLLVLIMKLLGKPIRITEGYRSLERQKELYNKRPKVTNAKAGQSYHNWGVAFDIVFEKTGYDAPESDWQLVGRIGKRIGLEWGGDWKTFTDRPHFQYRLGYHWSDFQKGKVDLSEFNLK